MARGGEKGRAARQAFVESLKMRRWGGVVTTETVKITLPVALIEAVRATAKRDHRPIGAVLCDCLDPEKVSALSDCSD